MEGRTLSPLVAVSLVCLASGCSGKDDSISISINLPACTDTAGGGCCDAGTPDADADDGGYSIADADADADGYSIADGDCDDTDPTVNPGATEVCDALDVDEDCDGLSDDDDPSATGGLDYAPDADGDGYGDETALAAWCDVPSGYVADATDCNDEDASTYPGASEAGAGLLSDPACDGGDWGWLGGADFKFIGEDRYDSAGRSVSTAGDVDGDGLDDLIVGAYGNDDRGYNAGKAYLILGSTLDASEPGSIDLGNADFEFIGENRGDSAGSSVSTAGDVDGDGLDDLIVGAPYADYFDRRDGKAYLILGSTLAAYSSAGVREIHLGNADFVFFGAGSDDYAGYSVSTAGDVDGDGLDDLIVGAYENYGRGEAAGKAYLLLGRTLAASLSPIYLGDADFEFIGENSGDEAGISVSTAGDVDGDGRDDLIVGAPENDDGGDNAGKTYLILGSTLDASGPGSIDLGDADFAFIGENPGDNAGESVSTAGDVDGDGLDDLFVGAPRVPYFGSAVGKAYLILGSTLDASGPGSIDLSNADFEFVGENPGDFAGRSVSTAGDVDGDGRGDLIVGAHQFSFSSDWLIHGGKVYLILGSTLAASSTSIDLSNADFAFIGGEPDAYAGVSVSTAGDVNGDGRDDLIVGAPGHSTGWTPDHGMAYLILSEL